MLFPRHNAVDCLPTRLQFAACLGVLLVALLIAAPAVAQATWIDPVRVSDDLVDSSAAIGVADNGTTTVIWTTPSGPDPGQMIRMARVSASGTVGPPIDIVRSDSRFTIVDAALGVGPDGTAVVAWSDFLNNPSRVSAVRISPDNRLGPVQTLAIPAYNGIPPAYGKRVVVDSAGTATVVWYRDLPDGSASVVEAARLPADAAAEPARVVGSAGGHLHPSIAVQRDGRVLVAWSGAFDRPRFTTINAAGAQGAVHELAGVPGGRTAIAAAANGPALVAWSPYFSDNSLHVRRVTSDGALGPDIQLSEAGEPASKYQLAVADSGVLTALWTTSAYQDLRIAHLLSDNTVVAPATVSTAPPDACPIGPQLPPPGLPSPSVCIQEIALSIDSANNAQAAWSSADNRVYVRRMPFGAPAEAKRVLSPPSEGPSRALASVTATSGIGTTMWLDSSSGTQQLYVAPSGSGAFVDAPPPPPPSPPPPPPPPTRADCTDLQLIGVRGTTQKQADKHAGWGDNGAAFRDRLVKVLGALGERATKLGLVYPAEPETFSLVGLAGYFPSVAKGHAALVKQLRADTEVMNCYVLMGYSQGAHVVGDVLETSELSWSIRNRIVAVVLLADPRFNPLDTTIQRYGSFEPDRGGFFSPREAGAMVSDGFDYEVLTACKKKDFWCQSAGALNPFAAIDAHNDYKSWAKNLADIVAEMVKERFGSPSPAARDSSPGPCCD